MGHGRRQARPAHWQDNDGNKGQAVEIQVTHIGPDLQFQTAATFAEEIQSV